MKSLTLANLEGGLGSSSILDLEYLGSELIQEPGVYEEEEVN